jgi:hypothetical protein
MSDLLNSASLVLIPSGYKEDTVYSVVPSDGSGDLSFTRASNGTRVNSAGLVEVCPWNLYEDSENFSVNALASASITSNTTTAPNGTTTADSLVEDGTNNLHAVYDFGAITYVAGIYTLSCYVKKGSRDWVRIQLYDGTNTPSAYANVNTGVLGVVSSGATSSIESVGDGWYRVILSATMASAVGGWAIYGATSDGGTTYQGVNGSTALYLWGIQCNIGSTAKPYFPTTDRLNVPRLTYQNGGGGCPSLLLEKQSTNLAFPSEDLTAWTSGGMTNTANQITSPDGTQNADKSTIGSTPRYYDVITSGITTVNGTTYTTSFFAKKGTGIESIYFYQGDGGRIAKWNLNNGVYIGYAPADGYTAFTSYGSESLGNGWYRFYATYTASSTSGNLTIGVSTNTNDSVTPISGNGTDFVYVWGLQYEASTYATSYIPTTSASATRVADACSKTGISSLIGQTSGTIFYDGYFGNEPDEVYVFLQKSGSTGINDSIYLQKLSNDVKIYLNVYSGGSSQCFIGGGNFAVGDRIKIAAAYANNDFMIYINGTQISFDTSGTPPTCDNLQIGTYTGAPSTAIYITSKPINEVVLFPVRLTNSELASLTSL